MMKTSTDLTLVEIKGDRLWTTSRIISDKFGRPHRSVLKSIDDLVTGGTITQQGFLLSEYIDASGKANRMYLLEERSALIAMPFIGGKKSREGQVVLVDNFLAMRKELERLHMQRNAQDWIEARKSGKQSRLSETDTVKEFVEYATRQGSSNAGMYYMQITKGTYSALFILEHGGKWDGIRECLSAMQLTTLASSEQIAQKALRESMEMEMHYKDAYKYAIGKVKAFAELIGVTKIPDSITPKLVAIDGKALAQ
jgi:phage regulator Rha-like protein